MKRRMIAGALVILALSMAACVNVPGYGLVSVSDLDKIEEQEQQRQMEQARESPQGQRLIRQRQEADERQAREEQRQQEEAEQRRQEQAARQEAERLARQEQAARQEAERLAREEQAARQETERLAREEQRQQEEAARRTRGNVNLYSAYAGTVLVNGGATQFTVEAGKYVNVTIEDAIGKEHTIAVRDSGGTVRQASAKVNITSDATYYPASILDPNPPPNSGDDFNITQNAQGSVTITGYTGTRVQVVIPQTIEGIRVTEIGGSAFIGDLLGKRLFSVVIPNGVTSIGREAFAYNLLASVTIPNSVTTIGSRAFAYNYQLTSVTIGNGVTSIGDEAFGYNPITTITIPANVRAGTSSFPYNFSAFYESQSRRAGTYTWSGRVWTVR